jgi:hypothetical protein
VSILPYRPAPFKPDRWAEAFPVEPALLPPEFDPGEDDLPNLDAALPFAEWVDAQADFYGNLGTPAGRWLAGQIRELADLARLLNAATPDQFDGRLRAMDGDHLRVAETEGGES